MTPRKTESCGNTAGSTSQVPENHLRDDARNWDFGYPRTVLRPDGIVVTAFFYTTDENPEKHIAVTIFDPEELDG